MASKDIINHIRHFFKTADEKALAEVRAAASVEIEGDISIEEYLSGFGDGYFYAHEDESNYYISGSMQLQANARQYEETGFEGAPSYYGRTDLTVNMELSHKGELTKMIKKSA
ncbi:MAG: hypothetical protein K2H22_09320 [Muribaculaceae bacterium]|nr:hypothetical protein [Muribaculaceae bacterium]